MHLRNNMKQATLICVSDTSVSESATLPVLDAIEAVSCTQPGTHRANL